MKSTYGKALAMELLEQKQMLAGDVLVSILNGRLLVEGDAAANQIAITAGATDGSVNIQGLNGTNIRLGSAPSTDPPAPASGLVVEGVKGDVRVNLGEGDDSVAVHDVTLRRDLIINTGAGADTVNVGMTGGATATSEDASANVNVRGSLLIRTGSENDTVNVGSANIRGVLGIATDGGDDAVNVGLEIGDETAGASNQDEPVSLHARAGIDIALGDGTDSATIIDVRARAQVVVGGGAGVDAISLEDLTTGFLGIRGGEGDGADQVTLTGVKAFVGSIELGGGADVASITDSAFNSLAVALGSGNDKLSIQTVKATYALLGGGAGTGDELADAGNNTIAHRVVAGFEIPVDVNTPPLFSRAREEAGKLLGGLSGLLNRLRR